MREFKTESNNHGYQPPKSTRQSPPRGRGTLYDHFKSVNQTGNSAISISVSSYWDWAWSDLEQGIVFAKRARSSIISPNTCLARCLHLSIWTSHNRCALTRHVNTRCIYSWYYSHLYRCVGSSDVYSHGHGPFIHICI